MSSKVPVSKQIAWISLIPHLIVMALIAFAINLFVDNLPDIILNAAILYILLSFTLRKVIAKDHNKGMGLVKQGNYNDAISCFQASYEFFSKHDWIDKYRYLTLLSSSKITYREMALCNIAFCYIQGEDRKQGEKYYQRALKEFPNSILATTALKFLGSEVE